jgi:hypothetical protein
MKEKTIDRNVGNSVKYSYSDFFWCQWDCASSRRFVAALRSFLVRRRACMAELRSNPIDIRVVREASDGCGSMGTVSSS